ncbi:hypothetical protein IVB03_26185 [Bradyrhizobium sp. 168]|uniref:hypothetical protein n=1 Tax=Bradyrhizobium sp. 168 TaxID=2782639 RepID=UPI001FFB6C39|nr:hypothetical protein [Bradyrhizobium sp. 168]MCK1582952.1 hypothetical protein [Bradyrhizobium sp. 168]
MDKTQRRISLAEYVGELSTFLGRSVRQHLIVIPLGTLAAMLVTFFLSQTVPATYSARASVRLARLDGQDLMTPQATAAHMNMRTFLTRALGTAGPADGSNQRDRSLILDSFNARPNTSDSLTLVLIATSEQQALNALGATVQQLNKDQEKLRSPLLSELEAQLALADSNVASLTRIRESLATSDSIMPSTTGDAAALALRRVWLLDLMARNEEKLAAANAELRALATRKGSTKTYPASLSEDVLIAQVSPQPVRHALFAGAIALLALLLYAMIRLPRSARVD